MTCSASRWPSTPECRTPRTWARTVSTRRRSVTIALPRPCSRRWLIRSSAPRPGSAPDVLMLEGKRILVTGVITRRSIAYTVAEQAQQQGAEVLLTGFGRAKRMTERAPAKLPDPPGAPLGKVAGAARRARARREQARGPRRAHQRAGIPLGRRRRRAARHRIRS